MIIKYRTMPMGKNQEVDSYETDSLRSVWRQII